MTLRPRHIFRGGFLHVTRSARNIDQGAICNADHTGTQRFKLLDQWQGSKPRPWLEQYREQRHDSTFPPKKVYAGSKDTSFRILYGFRPERILFCPLQTDLASSPSRTSWQPVFFRMTTVPLCLVQVTLALSALLEMSCTTALVYNVLYHIL